MRLDARIPVRIVPWDGSGTGSTLLPAADPQAVVLVASGSAGLPARPEGWAAIRHLPAPAPAFGLADTTIHPASCFCCSGGRSALAVMLSELFMQRAKGQLGLFRRVLLLAPAAAAGSLRTVLLDDPLVAGRYREDPALGEN